MPGMERQWRRDERPRVCHNNNTMRVEECPDQWPPVDNREHQLVD